MPLTLSPPIPLSLYTLPYRSNPPSLISDIGALWCSVASARVPECQKLKMVGSWVYLDFLTKRGWSQCQEVADQKQTKQILQMCHCRPTCYILYIVLCDINMTTFDKGELALLG